MVFRHVEGIECDDFKKEALSVFNLLTGGKMKRSEDSDFSATIGSLYRISRKIVSLRFSLALPSELAVALPVVQTMS